MIAKATKYDSAIFGSALLKFSAGAATDLTDEEIGMLSFVSERLGQRALAKRAGFVEDLDDDMQALARTPFSWKDHIDHEKDYLEPMLLAHRIMLRELQEAVKMLHDLRPPPGVAAIGDTGIAEAKLARDGGLTVASAALMQKDLDALRTRLRAVEERPTMHWVGVWDPTVAYKEAACVSWGGSMWYATKANRSSRPGDASTDPAWRLAVQRGRDGKSWKDADRDRDRP